MGRGGLWECWHWEEEEWILPVYCTLTSPSCSPPAHHTLARPRPAPPGTKGSLCITGWLNEIRELPPPPPPKQTHRTKQLPVRLSVEPTARTEQLIAVQLTVDAHRLSLFKSFQIAAEKTLKGNFYLHITALLFHTLLLSIIITTSLL